MKIEFNLVFNSKGDIRAYKKRPTVYFNEICLALTLNLPDELFEMPQLHGVINIPQDVVKPTLITPEIKSNIEKAIQTHSGIEVKLEIKDQNDKDSKYKP